MGKPRASKAKNPETGLTGNEELFCQEYIRNGYNATQAYLTVYDCEYTTANGRAHTILKKPEAKAYVYKLQQEAFEQKAINAERIALRLAEIAFAEKTDPNYNASAQLKALDLLQKQLGLQNQKIQADLDSTVKISIGISED